MYPNNLMRLTIYVVTVAKSLHQIDPDSLHGDVV